MTAVPVEVGERHRVRVLFIVFHFSTSAAGSLQSPPHASFEQTSLPPPCYLEKRHFHVSLRCNTFQHRFQRKGAYLRSATTRAAIVVGTKLEDRAFSVAATQLRNSLPPLFRLIDSHTNSI